MNDGKNGVNMVAVKSNGWGIGVKRTVYGLVGGIVLGLLLPRATVYEGLMPFGIGFVSAASGPSAVLIYAATCMGYLLRGTAVSLRYLAALAAVAGIRWAVSGFRAVSRSSIFPAATAFVGLLVTGSALFLGVNPSVTAVLTIVAESLLGGGFAYFTAILWRDFTDADELTTGGKLSAVVLTAAATIALLTVEFAGIAPGRILCGVVILLAAHCVGMAGASVGVLMGVAVLLSTPHMTHLAPAFALGGVLTAVFAQKGKWVSACMYLVSVCIATVQAQSEIVVVVGLYEAVASCTLFLAMPPLVEKKIARFFLKAHRLPEVDASRNAACLQMTYASNAMKDVVGIVDAVSLQLKSSDAPDIGSMCHSCADELCRTCKRRSVCWGTHFSSAMDSLNQLPPILREKGEISKEDIVGYLQSDCLFTEKMADRISARYREFAVHESAYRRLNALRGVVNDQFLGTATMLSEFAERFSVPEWTDVETEKRIRNVLEKENVSLLSASCRVSDRGRMTVELLLEGKYRPHNNIALQRTISTLSGRAFTSPITEYAANVTRISFVEQPTYTVEVATAQLLCKGETLCGDSYETFRDNEGCQLLVLSDGMGSGGGAAADSAIAAGLAVKLFKAGFGYESTLKLINSVLMAKSDDERLATLDVVDINLYSGVVRLLKAGAGASLLYSRGRISRIEEASLPLGILRELTFAQTNDRLTNGDILITMSDGVSNEGLSWVEDVIKQHVTAKETDLKVLADTIATKARERQGEDEDDITVLVAQLNVAT